jgi:phosphoglycolate phosphatase
VPAQERVVLCGLSGVLIQHDQPYRDAVVGSCAVLLGIADSQVSYRAGGSDPDTLRRTLAGSGAAPEQLTELVERASELLRQNLRQAREAIAEASRTAGSAELLTQLKHRQQAPISVLTGHSRDNAELLLSSIGLDRYLDFGLGGYGDEAPDRAALVAVAQHKVAAGCGSDQAARLVVLTDVPEDLIAASARGLRAIGVVTQAATEADLTAAGAEQVLPSLADVPAALAALLD